MAEKFQVQKEHPAHLDRFTGLQDPIHGVDPDPEFFIHARIFTALRPDAGLSRQFKSGCCALNIKFDSSEKPKEDQIEWNNSLLLISTA